MKLMETRKNATGDVRRRYVCLGGCGQHRTTVTPLVVTFDRNGHAQVG